MIRLSLFVALLFAVVVLPAPCVRKSAVADPVALSLYRQMNQERVQRKLSPLHWDGVLQKAAESHLIWLERNGQLSHQFEGEPDLTARAAGAGAHLSVAAENLAIGPDAVAIHNGWMHSPHHRDNILDPQLDAVGFAVAHTARGYWVVADYGRRVEELKPEEVEAKVALLLREHKVRVSAEHARAREACAMEGGMPGGKSPRFLMRWQSPELTAMPDALLKRLSSYPNAVASVGACPAETAENFSSYRVAVLLD